MDWKILKEDMPAQYHVVLLICVGFKYRMGFYDFNDKAGKYFDCYGERYALDQILYWDYLPEIPSRQKLNEIKKKDYIIFNCNGEHCIKTLGWIDPKNGHLIQKSSRWHFQIELIDGIIQCKCGWTFHYKAEDFIERKE